MESKGLLKLLKLDSLIEHLTGYAEDKIALFKIEAKEELSTVITKVIIIFLVVVFAAFFLLFASLTLAIYLNSVLNSSISGFAIVALIYLVVLVAVVLLKDHKAFHRLVEKSVNNNSEDNE